MLEVSHPPVKKTADSPFILVLFLYLAWETVTRSDLWPAELWLWTANVSATRWQCSTRNTHTRVFWFCSGFNKVEWYIVIKKREEKKKQARSNVTFDPCFGTTHPEKNQRKHAGQFLLSHWTSKALPLSCWSYQNFL